MNERSFSDIELSELGYSQREISGIRQMEQAISDLIEVDWDKYILSLQEWKKVLCKTIPKLQEVVDARTDRIRKEVDYYKSIHRAIYSDWDLFISDSSLQSSIYSDLAAVRARINLVREELYEDTLRLEKAKDELLSLGYKLEPVTEMTAQKNKDGQNKMVKSKKYRPVRQTNITGKIEWARQEKSLSNNISSIGYRQSVGILE